MARRTRSTSARSGTAPIAPTAPTADTAAVADTAPVAPVAPLAPVAPVAPVAPGARRAPLAPTAPTAPLAEATDFSLRTTHRTETLSDSVIDTPWNTVPHLPALKVAGVETVIRYYNRANSTKLPQKKLTPSEARAISAAGLSIAVVYQDRQREIADFGYDNGRAAGERAGLYARGDIGQPSGSAIYFAADEDFGDDALGAIGEYFRGARDGLFSAGAGGLYRLGAYGSGKVLAHLREAGLADFFWLAMATGWRGYRAFRDSGHWHLLQKQETRLNGLGLDTNEANPAHASFGAFRLDAGALPAPPAGATHVVIARGGLYLRQGPGTEFARVRLMPVGTPLTILKVSGDWAMVDLEGDGAADGYCFAGFLELV